MNSLPCFLDLGDGQPPIPCRDERQALLLARVYVAATTGQPAVSTPAPTADENPPP